VAAAELTVSYIICKGDSLNTPRKMEETKPETESVNEFCTDRARRCGVVLIISCMMIHVIGRRQPCQCISAFQGHLDPNVWGQTVVIQGVTYQRAILAYPTTPGPVTRHITCGVVYNLISSHFLFLLRLVLHGLPFGYV